MSFTVPDYKVIAFDPIAGLISLSFKNLDAISYYAPIVDGAYLSGANLDMWIKGLFSSLAYSDVGVPGPVYADVTNAEAVLAMVDTTGF